MKFHKFILEKEIIVVVVVGGVYHATSYMDNPRSEVNDSLISKQLKRAKRLVEQGAVFDAGDTYFDVKTGENRTLTFYFDDIK